MKRNANKILVKDILAAAIAWGIFALIFKYACSDTMSPTDAGLMATFFAGIPFGWRWSSKLITAVSFKGIFIKLAISFFLGFIAIAVVIGSDIIRCISANIAEKKDTARFVESM